VVRAMSESRLREVLSEQALLGNAQELVTLQAADMTAWLSQKSCKGDGSFSWVRGQMPECDAPRRTACA